MPRPRPKAVTVSASRPAGTYGADVSSPEWPPEPGRDGELEARDHAARADDAGELTEGRRRVVDITKEVREGERVEGGVVEREVFGARLDELDVRGQTLARNREHLRALVDTNDGAALLAEQLLCDRARTGGDVQHFFAGACLDSRDEESPPAGVLSE